MRGIGKVILYGSGRDEESENFRESIIITASGPPTDIGRHAAPAGAAHPLASIRSISRRHALAFCYSVIIAHVVGRHGQSTGVGLRFLGGNLGI